MKTNFNYRHTTTKTKLFSVVRYVLMLCFFAGMTSKSSGQTLIEYLLYAPNDMTGTLSDYNHSTNISYYNGQDGNIQLNWPYEYLDATVWFDNPLDAAAYIQYYWDSSTVVGCPIIPIGTGAYIDGLKAGSYIAIYIDVSSSWVFKGYFTLTQPYAWQLNGNGGPTDSVSFGTNDTTDLRIMTNNSERMRILKTGNIGIGTSFPSEKLQVVGNVRVEGIVRIDSLSGIGNRALYVDSIGRVLPFSSWRGPSPSPCGVFDTWYLGDSIGDIVRCSGKVGIGTSNPTQKLEIDHSDSTGISAGILLSNTSSYNKNSEIKFNQNGTPLWAIGNDLNHNGGRNFFIFDEQATANSTRFYIDGAGRVGIGVIPPTSWAGSIHYKLYVDSGIATRDVKVQATGWPDYVLKDDYKLIPLPELESYVKINNHLPGVPSADDVEKNDGFELGAMQTKLLKKVEELTLYIIEQQKQMDEMKKQLDAIKK